MQLNLSQIGFLLLILSGAARLLLLTVPLVKFIQIFDKKIVEGSRLINSLEIPGLRRFVRDEVVLGFMPYFALYVAIRVFDLDDHAASKMPFFLLLLLTILLFLWLIFDWWRSFSIYDKLSRLHKETKQVKSIAGNTLDGLRFLVHVRGSVQKTAVKLGFRAMVGVIKGKLKRKEKEEGKTPTGTVAISLVDRLISFPERVTGKLTDWAKEDLDGKLQKKFQRYADRSFLRLSLIFVWGLFPSVLLSIVSLI